MENRTKTVIENLEEQFDKFVAWNIEGDPKAIEFTVNDMYKAFREAVQEEKEQIKNAFYDGSESWDETSDEYYRRVYTEGEDGLDNPVIKFKVGDPVIVHPATVAIPATITRVEWCSRNRDWKYYFITPEGEEMWESADGLEPRTYEL